MKKNRNAWKVSAVVLALSIAISAFSITAMAEELPVGLPTPDHATVSQETDNATNTDPDMGTKFYMYIPPDVVAKDYPQMGDEGVSVNIFLAGAALSGIGYLATSAYAKEKKQLA